MFKYSLDNKRYYTLNYYNKMKYNSKVFKISLNAGFSYISEYIIVMLSCDRKNKSMIYEAITTYYY